MKRVGYPGLVDDHASEHSRKRPGYILHRRRCIFIVMTSLSVAIVNESFVDTFWAGQPPIGKRLRTTDRDKAGEWRTVVGVVPNIMQGDALRQRFKPLVYVPFRQDPPALAFFLLRTGGRPDLLAQTVRADVQKLDADVVLENFTTLKA